ncbi:MAG: glutamyl-tRNA reductase [Acidobacteriota bacterium]|jgi:glutamyl-tRNA reductase
MLNLVIVGLNHRTAELDIRQRAAFPVPQLPDMLKRMTQQPGIEEGMIISTCNRVELLSRVEKPEKGIDTLEAFFSETCEVPAEKLKAHLYRHVDHQAVRHAFRVASSLDSMILGEAQILGQVKSFYGIAAGAATVGYYLNSLMQAAFHTAKRVRAETSIGEFSVSVSSAAVELARKIFGDLRNKKILIVGTGEMGQVAAQHLVSAGANLIRVTNRNPDAARKLAESFQGEAVPFDSLARWVARSDIVITSTGSQEILIDRAMAATAASERRHAPIVFIDISVPRNVDPGVAILDNVFCYDVDDLGAVVEANIGERRAAAAHAEKIVDEEVEAFCTRIKSRDVGPVVVQLQDRIEEICRTELERFLRRAGPRNDREIRELEWMVSRIANKIAHPLVMQLRSAHHSSTHRETYLDTIKRIFNL